MISTRATPGRWVIRHPLLLALEGWYQVEGLHVKVSCRFSDIMRASKTKHFTSCFRETGQHSIQRERRCQDPRWGIVWTPDKHGDFLGRAFIHVEDNNAITVDKVYGNKLTFKIISNILNDANISIECRSSGTDTYLA